MKINAQSTSSEFSVDRSGLFIDAESSSDEIAFSIRLWYLPVDYRGPLTIVNRDTGEQYPYELKSEDITRPGPQK